ncbi:MAG TPA: alpha/beta hydrolase [Candidatus Eisenbacteria bacterium]|nr:alpha/beta hydrolase [Candidatus Eisenbacteria bacterium]
MRRPFAYLAPILLVLASSLLVAGDLPPWSDSNGMGEPAIVLIHSAGSDRSVWDLVMPALVANHRVIRVELPGHGASPAIAKVDVKSVAAAVDRALAKEKVERAILVGHSYGGWVALEEAVAHPKRAAAVVVIDMGAYTPRDSIRTATLELHLKERYPSLVRVMFEVMSVDPVECDSAVALALRTPPEVLTAYLKDAWQADLRPRIKNLKTPVHVVAAEATWPVSRTWEQMQEAFGYRTAGPVEGHRVMASGHLVMRDQPDSLVAIVEGIAASLPKR